MCRISFHNNDVVIVMWPALLASYSSTRVHSVSKLCLTLCGPMDCSLPGSSMIFPRQEYWSGLPIPSVRGSSQPKD